MIANQVALVRRELWENRSIFVTPAAVTLVMALLVLTLFVAASGFGQAVDIGIITAQNVGDTERRAALMALLIGNTTLSVFAAGILTIFYCLASRLETSCRCSLESTLTGASTALAQAAASCGGA